MLRKLLPSLFQSAPRRAAAPQKASSHAPLPIQSAEVLLGTPLRKELLRQIKLLTSIPDNRWSSLYLSMFQQYAALVQELPASEVHHHADLGGMLDHALEVVHNALKLRRGYVLPPGSAPEMSGPLAELYTYAAASAGLLHDIGKIACDQHIELIEAGNMRRWFPWEGPMRGKGYRIRFVPERRYAIHEPTSLLLAQQIIPPQGLSWLASDMEVWANWVLTVGGRTEEAGPLGEIIAKADGASVARNLGAKPSNPAANTQQKPIHQKMLAALRYLLHEGKLPLNRPGAAGWLTQDALWLVSKVVADAVRAQLLADGQDGIPTQNTRIFDILIDHQVIIPCDDKAIWTCRVDNGQGWVHDFTLLRVDPARIWAEGRRPATFGGMVTPVEVTAGGVAAEHETSTIESPGNVPPFAVPASAPTFHSQPSSAYLESPAVLTDTGLPSLTAELPVPGITDTLNQSLDALTAGLLSQPVDVEAAEIFPDPPGLTSDYAVTPTGKASAKRQAAVPTPLLPPHTPPDSPRALGALFHAWVRENVRQRSLAINEANAMVHAVSDGVFLVTPGIFQAFAKAHVDLCAPFAGQDDATANPKSEADQLVDFARSLKNGVPGKASKSPAAIDRGVWRVVQKGFQQLKLHEKTLGGESVWICQVQGARRTAQLKGFFLPDPLTIFDQLVANNPFLTLKRD